MNKTKIRKRVQGALSSSLTSVFENFQNQIFQVMDEVGEPREKYHLKIYPFTLKRIDGKPVPPRLLKAIKARLEQKTTST